MPPFNVVPTHGLWYVDRNDGEITRLDSEPNPINDLSESELWVLEACLRLALRRLEVIKASRQEIHVTVRGGSGSPVGALAGTGGTIGFGSTRAV